MNVIIIEDEKPSARRLQRMLEKQGVSVSQMLHSVKEAVNWFNNNPHPELIFLDVQLGDGLSFEIFEEIDLKSTVVFTTAYDEYALRAFKLNSVDYLLKPIDDEELGNALKKYKNQLQKTPMDLTELQRFLKAETSENRYKTRFSVKVGQHLKFFATTEIECFFSENKGTYLHTASNRNYLLETTLENLENELPPDDFFRVNRSFYINHRAIQDIVRYSNSRFKIKLKNFDEHEIIVSRERAKAFKKWLG